MNNTTPQPQTAKEMYREWYHDYQNKYYSANNALAGLTGYMAATAKYSSGISTKERIEILQYLTKIWRNHEPGELTERWCAEWEEKIKELSAEEFGLLKK